MKMRIKEMYSLEKVGWRASCHECDYVEEGATKAGVKAHILDHIRVVHLGWRPRHPQSLDPDYEKRREENKDKTWHNRPIETHLVADCWCGAKGLDFAEQRGRTNEATHTTP